MLTRKKLIPAVLVAYFLIAVGYAFFSFYRERENLFLQLESTLGTAAYSLDIILGNDFYDVYTPSNPIPAEQETTVTDKLDKLASSFGIEYIYAMVKTRDGVFFTVSNEHHQTVTGTTPRIFYKRYPKPPDELLAACSTGQTKFLYFASPINLWDSYYSIFMPRVTPGGVRYVLAADIKLEHQRRLLESLIAESLVLVLLLLIPAGIGVWIFSVMTRRREIDLGTELYYDLLTGLPNLNSFMKKTRGQPAPGASLIVFNIDTFRNINSLFGLQTGDETLVRIGDLLSGACSSSDFSTSFRRTNSSSRRSDARWQKCGRLPNVRFRNSRR